MHIKYDTAKGLSAMKKFGLRKLLLVCAIPLVLVLGYVLYVFLAYYRLDDNLPLTVSSSVENGTSIKANRTYRITSGNIGFGAYSEDYSFFMDGGTKSRALSEEAVYENITGSANAVLELKPDILLFQEVDTNGTRSYHVNERDFLVDFLAESNGKIDYTFAQNYDSPYLFFPITEPHGKNQSGMLTVSSFPITQATRYSLPIESGFMKFLDLDRCYTKQRIPANNGKELILYNLHLSAYTSKPETATNQLLLLFEDMEEEYDKGNYIVGGGDFNKDLLGNSAKYFPSGNTEENWAQPIPAELIPDFLQIVAPFNEQNPVPSCRNADSAYTPDSFVLTVDGFVISKNVALIQADVLDTGFQWSDHNPVYMDFSLL